MIIVTFLPFIALVALNAWQFVGTLAISAAANEYYRIQISLFSVQQENYPIS